MNDGWTSKSISGPIWLTVKNYRLRQKIINILFQIRAGRRMYLLKYFKENMTESDKVAAIDMQFSAPALQVADVNLMSKAILNWLRGDVIDSPMFLPQ